MNKQSSRTSLFLIELVLSIFFFIIAAAICLQLFVNTFFISQETIETNHAVFWSQNLAEPFLGSSGDFSVVKGLYAEQDCISELPFETEHYLLLCFDKDWNAVPASCESAYLVFSAFHRDEAFNYQDIYIAKSPDELASLQSPDTLLSILSDEDFKIYQLSVKKFIP